MNPISTLHMASLIADALLSAGIVKQEDFDRAEAIAEEEMRVRLILGNVISVGDSHDPAS